MKDPISKFSQRPEFYPLDSPLYRAIRSGSQRPDMESPIYQRLSAHCSNDYCGLIRLWPPIWSQAGEFANKSHHRTLFCSSHQLAFIALQSLAPALALQPRDNLMYIITDTRAKSVVKCCRTLKIRRGYWNHDFEFWIYFSWTVLLGVVLGMRTHPKLCFADKKHKYKNQHPHHQELKHISLSRKYSA